MAEGEPELVLADPLSWLQRLGDRALGLLALIVALALLSSLPLVQILVLGYVLAAGTRALEAGRLREALPGLELFARIGGVALGFWLLLWIQRLLASLADSARLINPESQSAGRLDGFALVLALALVAHGLAACARGARLRYMLVPRPKREMDALARLFTREGYGRARDQVWDAFASLELGRLARTSLLGLVAALAWLLVPTTLLALGSRMPVFAVLGSLTMAGVLAFLPFVQLQVSEAGSLRPLVEVESIRAARAAAPLAMAGALVLTVLAALPLYLLKIELIPREAMWLPGLLFVALMLPARLACGLALHRGRRLADQPRHWVWRGLAGVLWVPAALAYGVGLYFTQYLSWYGTWSLYEQHAFLLPVPFLGG